MNEKKSPVTRRKFLMSVGLGGAAGAAAIVARQPQSPSPGDASAKSDSRGYQSTAHVKNYYRTAKV